MYGGDGSDFEIPDFEEVRRDFGIKDTPKYRKPAMAKFSSIMDLLNGFILDGIIGNYKRAELPLIHQNLDNIQDLIIPEKSIFIFEFKLNKSAEEALAQIDEKEYAKKFSFEGKHVWKIGVNFSSEKRTVDEWKIAK